MTPDRSGRGPTESTSVPSERDVRRSKGVAEALPFDSIPYLSTFQDRLRWLLRVRGLSQSQLARQLGLTQQTIHNLVKGTAKFPTAANFLRLADELGCDGQWLMSGVKHPRGPTPVIKADEYLLIQVMKKASLEDQALLLASAKQLSASITPA